MTNRKFAEQNKEFIAACRRVEIQPTKRQASKFRNRRGLAYKHRGSGGKDDN